MTFARMSCEGGGTNNLMSAIVESNTIRKDYIAQIHISFLWT